MRTDLVTAATGSSLQRLAEAAWQRFGDDSTLHFEGEVWTGSQLAARTRRLSRGLRDAGLQQGDRVVVCMANCPEVGITYSAVWRAGAATTPVLFLLSEDELRHVLADSEAAFVVTTPDFLPKVVASATGVATVRGIIVVGDPGGVDATVPLLDYAELEAASEGDLVDRDPGDLAALLYTGGTTGRSKGVMLSHDALSSAAWAAVAAGDDREEPTRSSLLPLPLSHVYGLTVTIMGLHATEPGTSVLMRWFDPAGWLQLADEHRTEISALVPSMFQMLLTQPIENYDLSALRRVASGGASLPREVAEEFQKRVPQVEITEGYGCTESGAIISTSPPGQIRPGSVGKPPAPIEVRIEKTDGTGDAVVGEDGEICVRGPNLMTGYWHAPDETALALRDGWLHTGDIGHFDADGFLYVVDRIKDLIIRGGINVYPRDVEEALLEHPDIVGAGVVGKPDPRMGEEVVAFVQLRPGVELTPDDVIGYAKEHLSAAKYPRDVRIVDALPLTSVFKLDRKRLRTLL